MVWNMFKVNYKNTRSTSIMSFWCFYCICIMYCKWLKPGKKHSTKTLTLPTRTSRISESCIKIKINLNFYFHTPLWCLKRFYEGLKGLHKIFWAPQSSVKIKIQNNFYFNTTTWNVRGAKGKNFLAQSALITFFCKTFCTQRPSLTTFCFSFLNL